MIALPLFRKEYIHTQKVWNICLLLWCNEEEEKVSLLSWSVLLYLETEIDVDDHDWLSNKTKDLRYVTFHGNISTIQRVTAGGASL